MIATQFHTKIKSFRSDNAAEFLDSYTSQFFAKEGILHQTTCVDSPQQNGVVERKHKHL